MADASADKEGKEPVGLKLLGMGLLIGLFIGAVTVYFLVVDRSSEALREQAERRAQKVEEGPKEPTDLAQVEIRRLPVPMVNGGGEILGYVFLDLSLEVSGPDDQSYVAARVPRLRDAYMRELSTGRTTREDRPGALDFDNLRQRLMTTTKSVIGDNKVLQMYVTQAMRAPS